MCSPVPHPGLGVDRLPDRPEQTQRREVVLRRVLGPPLHVRADRRRRRVQDRDPVALDDVPPAVLVREVGRPLVQHARRPVAERPVDDVAVPRSPSRCRPRTSRRRARASGRRRSGASSRRRRGSRRSCARSPSASRSSRSCRGGRGDPRSPSARTGTTPDPSAALDQLVPGEVPAGRHRHVGTRALADDDRAHTPGHDSSASSALRFSGTIVPRR